MRCEHRDEANSGELLARSEAKQIAEGAWLRVCGIGGNSSSTQEIDFFEGAGCS